MKIDVLKLLVVDAQLRSHTLFVARCPGCKGLGIGIRGMQPFHMTAAETMVLVEALRLGPECPLLKRKESRPFRSTIQPISLAGQWMLIADDREPGLVEFTGSGLGRLEPGKVRYLSLDEPARKELSDVLFRELMADGAKSASA